MKKLPLILAVVLLLAACSNRGYVDDVECLASTATRDIRYADTEVHEYTIVRHIEGGARRVSMPPYAARQRMH